MTLKKKLLIYLMLFASIMTFCQIDRVQVNEAYAAGVNLALKKEAYASGTYNETPNYTPDKINDGNYGTLWSDGQVNFTGTLGGYYYIAVDLAEEYIINQIIAYPRIDFDDSDMLHNWYIQLSNERDFSDAVTVAHIESKCEYGGKFVFDVDLEGSFRYVRIASPKAYFTCGELEVFGEKYDPEIMGGKHNFLDAQDQRYNAAAVVCDALGIIKATGKASFEGEKMLTRAAAAKSIATMMNYAIDANEESIFGDVPNDHYAKDYIMAAYRNNLIAKNDKFRPDEYITQGELCKMIIYAFGYAEISEKYPSWRKGTSEISSYLDLLKYVNCNFDDKLSRGMAAQVIFNALKAPLKGLAFSDSYNKIAMESPSENALYSLYGMRLYEGIVTQNSASTLTHPTDKRENYIMLDNMAFIDGDGLMQKMLGKKAGVLVDESDKVVAGYEDTLINETTIVYDSSFVSASGGVYTYKDVSRERRIKFDEHEVYVFKNYVAFPDWTYSDLEPADGYIEFIDNDRDGEIEVISIFKPEIVIGGYILPTDGDVNVVGYDGSKVSIDNPTWTRFMLNGNVTTPGRFMSNDVIYIYKSDNDAILFIEGYTNMISGVVSSADDEYATIDNVEYELSEYYITIKNNSSSDEDELLKLGENNKVLLDGRNRVICAVKDSINTEQDIIGFVGKVRCDTFEESCRMKIFTNRGEFETFDFADSVYMDNIRIKHLDLLTRIENGIVDINNKLIRFRVNSSGEINRVETLEKAEINLGSDIVYINNGYGIYNKGWMVMPLKPDTLCFTIPKSGNTYLYSDHTHEYRADLVSDNMSELDQIKDKWAFYDVDELGFPSVAVKYREVASFGAGLRSVSSSGQVDGLIVKKVNKYYDEESGEGYRIKGIDMNGKEKTIYLDTEITSIFKADDLQGDKFENTDSDPFDDYKDIIIDNLSEQDVTDYTMPVSDLEAGDLIRYELLDDLAVAVERTFDANSGKDGVYQRPVDGTYYSAGRMYPQYPDAEYRLVYGKAKKIVNDTFIMSTCEREAGKGALSQYVNYSDIQKVIICHGSNFTVYDGNVLPAYFKANQEVLLFTSDRANPTCLIMYE